ncbi:MAG: holo-ACP synthase [Labilithrix sp.]|nr:holo-ACP synthase [Labilithrix sp.]
MAGLSVGIDLVRTRSVEEAIAEFGDRYLRRVFTDAEVAYAMSAPAPAVASARLAARFAAKEAAMKALDLGERGVGWRDIEVVRTPTGAPALALHGNAAAALQERGTPTLSVSLSHEAEYATAVVVSLHSAGKASF